MAIKLCALGSASVLAMTMVAAPVHAQAVEAGQQTNPQPIPESMPADRQDDQESETSVPNEIVVTGVRASLVRALEVKRQATQVVESVVAEDIGKLPDNNVVEALQRITGIQVTDRASDEANTITIRGLPDITTTLNGRMVFTASGRQLALADVPATLVGRIDVYKTRGADQLPTGLAGQIDIRTRRPFDFDGFALSGYARGIYSEQADEVNPHLSALVSDRWETGIGDIGVLVNASYARTRYRDQVLTAGALVPFASATNPPPGSGAANSCDPSNPNGWIPLERIQPTDCRAPGQQIWVPGLQTGLPYAEGSTFTINGEEVPYLLSRDAVFQSDLHGERERPAVNAMVQWAPDEASTYSFEFFWNGFRSTTFNSLLFNFVDYAGGVQDDPAGSITTYDGTNIVHSRHVNFPYNFTSGDLTKSSTDSYVYALNGDWDLGQLHLTADASYQTSTFESRFIALRTNRVPASIDVNFNAGGGLPSFHYGDDSLATDPSQWQLGEFYDNANRNKGDAITFTADGDYEFSEGIFKKLSFGLRYDDRGASEAQRTQDAPVLNQPFDQLDSGFFYTNSGYYDGRADVPTSWVVPNGYYLLDHADEIRQLYQNSVDPGIQTSDQLALRRTFNVDEITMAAYVQGDFETRIFDRPLRLQVGARYVDVDTDLTFTDLLTGTTTRDSKAAASMLPSVTVMYDITDDLRMRFNFGKTLRRPNFVDLNPNYTLTGDLTNVGYGSGTGGNPDLNPTKATNYDLSLEWYFENDSALYGTLFRREVDGLVVPLRQFVTIPGSDLNTDNFIITRPANASDGVLKGAELGFVYFPDFLPGILDGLGAQGSLTLLDSKQNIPITDNEGNVVDERETGFFGVSDTSYNITGIYEHGPVGVRLSYVWRKNFLANNEASLFANPIGVWRRPESSLDFQFNYDITDRLALSFDATNLTNELSQAYYRFGDAGGPDMFNLGNTIIDRTFALGVRYSLD
ncbi:TonB-dependent receptor [Stakelama saccharophila]|uniref:TonB-dependent receptor n=1 Tax=Stakelama saccharophila TaxID=3075605 RepID=A0ABZ0B5R5_9SPHN|nr:TonB-dependent receptor [Stakelama sp. W311]WNO52345.1 TonB-dependent receptor [Stakelama sp. W311]